MSNTNKMPTLLLDPDTFDRLRTETNSPVVYGIGKAYGGKQIIMATNWYLGQPNTPFTIIRSDDSQK